MMPMIQIDDVVISPEIFMERFVCDLSSCKGICCVEGDAGAPLTNEEVEILERVLPEVWDDISEESKRVIEKQGVSYIDEDDEPVTSIVNGRECVFTYIDEYGMYKCAVEKAFREGRIDFYKPISCHLYPVRIQEYRDFTAVNVHKWNVCKCARTNGRKLDVPVYRFLKEPLIRRFGQEWYEQLEYAAIEFSE